MRVPRPFPCLPLLALLLPCPRGSAQAPATPTGHRRMDPGFQERQGMLLFQQGDSPRALLHLQRARLCAPGNPRLLQELDQVRNTLPKASRTSLPKPPLPFPYPPTFPQLVAATLAAWGLLCLTLLALLWHRKHGLQRLALSLALLTLLLATPTLAWTWRLHQTSPAVVITPVGKIVWGDRTIDYGWKEIGPNLKKLYDELTGIQYGRLPDTHGWTRVL